MKLIKQIAPSKSWTLVRNKATGDIITGDHAVYHYKPSALKIILDKAHQDHAAGIPVTGELGYYWRSSKIPLLDLEQLDHIPFYRGSLKFESIHNGTSSVQLILVSVNGGKYYLVGGSANDFLKRVGAGTIKMDSNGYYEFNFSFVKKSDKVFITLEADDLHG